MFYLPGKILRFRGPHAADELAAHEDALRGRCKREGDQLVITRPVQVSFSAALFAAVPAPQSDFCLSDFSRNGRHDAQRV